MTRPAPVLRATHVTLPADVAFRVFTEQLGAWWPLTTHGCFGADSAGVAFEGGLLVERSLTGERATWGEVLAWEPPHRLLVTWHPGRAEGPATQVEVRFVAVDGGTRVELAHSGWQALPDGGVAARARYSGRNAWGTVLDHYTDLVARSAGEDDGEADGEDEDPALEALSVAYATFFAEALAGGFADPADGGFTAEQTVAHVALNDEAMAAVCRAVIDGAGHEDGVRPPARFENERANDRAALQAFVDDQGGTLEGVVAAGRRRARTLRALLARLDATERAVPVHARLVSDGEVMLDDEVPWERLALAVQASRHLPDHTAQLRALRP